MISCQCRISPNTLYIFHVYEFSRVLIHLYKADSFIILVNACGGTPTSMTQWELTLSTPSYLLSFRLEPLDFGASNWTCVQLEILPSIFKCVSLDKTVWNFHKTLWQRLSKGVISDKLIPAQVAVWHLTSGKPLYEIMDTPVEPCYCKWNSNVIN